MNGLAVSLKQVVESAIPDAVVGGLHITRELMEDAPLSVREALAQYVDWSGIVYALPITDQALCVWYRTGEHRYLFANNLLERAAKELQRVMEAHKVRSVDVAAEYAGRISLVELGVRAGLGTRGLNNLLLHPKFGPWLQLHAILYEDVVDQPGMPLAHDVCVNCMKCVRACPADALSNDVFSAAKCSQLVAAPWNPKSKAIALTSASYLECDMCMRVCPIGTSPEGIFSWKR